MIEICSECREWPPIKVKMLKEIKFAHCAKEFVLHSAGTGEPLNPFFTHIILAAKSEWIKDF